MTKKTVKKIRNKSVESAVPAPKITLPAFGLAEEILGRSNADATAPDSRGGRPAAANPETAKNDEYHLVTFLLDSEEFGVDIGRVREILRVGQITLVPNAPLFIRGVINLRGKIIPVLELRKRFDLPETQLTKQSRIVVVEFGPKVLGLLVDSVSQVIRMPASSVEAPPDEVERSRAFVRGIGKMDSRLIMIMELDRVLAKDALVGTGRSRQRERNDLKSAGTG